jgi:hypothetical protein
VFHCCQFLVCSLPRYVRFYRPLLSCNNTPVVLVARLPCLQNCWKQFSCIRGYTIISVAWQWVFQFGLPHSMSHCIYRERAFKSYLILKVAIIVSNYYLLYSISK